MQRGAGPLLSARVYTHQVGPGLKKSEVNPEMGVGVEDSLIQQVCMQRVLCTKPFFKSRGYYSEESKSPCFHPRDWGGSGKK